MRCIAISIIAILSSGCVNAKNSEKLDIDSSHKILGTWILNKNNCDEIYIFNKDGIRNVESNEERVVSRFKLSPINESKGVFLLWDKVLEDNGEVDCSGSNIDMTGDVVEPFVLIEDSPKIG